MAKQSLLEAVRSGKILVCDGAMGTELQRMGLPFGLCGDAWNLDNPGAVAEVHHRYLDAGADLLLTNTFSTNKYRLAHFGLGERVREVAEQAVRILRGVISEHVWLVGELGPLGEFLEPFGDISRSEAIAAFRETVEVFVGEGVEAIIIETITSLDEMEAAVEAVRTVTDLPLAACFTFEVSPAGLRTMTGATPQQCAELLAQLPVDIVGCNCGTNITSTDYERIVQILSQTSQKPVLIEPNAGTPELVDGQIAYRTTPADFARAVPAYVQQGARIIGGCCGTGPDHIRAIRSAVDALSR
ncbi:MAG: homocysteine S-methyltransferase family protein [Candidatus Sumerlaeaceae bacterium]|nr:homocysteine S-methyltransferase family protein [Candidatus Sumerlaeaceae bacterium]